MKKLVFIFAGLFLMANVASSQGIDDRAVIPVAVTLNSILRLNVTSGGNIEFSFNTLSDYQNGIQTSAAYQTKFNIASSVDWDVYMYAEDANLTGTDIITEGGNTANVMDIENIGYHITSEDIANSDFYFSAPDADNTQPLASAATTRLVGYDGTNSNAGDITANSFTIHWRCGTQEPNMLGTSILAQGIAADRYATNVFLILQPAN